MYTSLRALITVLTGIGLGSPATAPDHSPAAAGTEIAQIHAAPEPLPAPAVNPVARIAAAPPVQRLAFAQSGPREIEISRRQVRCIVIAPAPIVR